MPRTPLSRLLPATLSLLAALAPMAQARAEGVWDLRRAGLEKVRSGLTSLEEINSVTID